MKTQLTLNLQVTDQAQADRVKQAFTTMHTHFGAKGIIKMEELFLKDAFIRNLVKMKLKKG